MSALPSLPPRLPGRAVVPVFVDERLRPVGRRPPLPSYLRELWRRRHFIGAFAAAQVRTENSRDRLGGLWLLVNPLLLGTSYYLIFGLLLGTGRGIDNFVGYLVIGIYLFQFSAQSITRCGRSILSQRKLIQALAFPRMAVPLAVILREAIVVVPALLVMLGVVLAAQPAEHWSPWALLLLPGLLLQILFNLGAGLLVARWAARVSDVANVLPFVTRVLLYLSGVFYSFDRYVEHPRVLALLEANPFHAFLTIAREAILWGRPAEGQVWVVAGLWTLGTFVIGLVLFWAAEEEYGRE